MGNPNAISELHDSRSSIHKLARDPILLRLRPSSDSKGRLRDSARFPRPAHQDAKPIVHDTRLSSVEDAPVSISVCRSMRSSITVAYECMTTVEQTSAEQAVA
ncbi:hypothetical protein BD324DRAFT_491786 [Kockovaella imperatae]|uniref:Uncharacterized protein n=1 Tax=Kockovaella imperatae TaxID=4999 RepID=A0A1Y1UFT7_9TREE|nr:hypothetical protein BD324DRAFT_491786 [Kockovaella imperatae]ORX36374.1 hypothetical protein BD324DRAFT_491786 [Kockovaella imperatae]